MLKKISLAVLIFLLFFSKVFAGDWKLSHKEADGLDLQAAQGRVAKNPQSVEAQYVLGLVYLNAHKDDDAYRIFTNLIANNLQMSEARWGQAESLRRKHQISQAQRLLENVIREDPQFSPALISLAYIKYFQMDFLNAAHLAAQVIRLGQDKSDLSNFVRAYALYAGAKGMLAHYGGIFSKAIDGLAVKANLDKAYRLQPRSPAVLFGLGSYYLLAPGIVGGNKARAGEYLQEALKVDPNFADVYVRLAQLAKGQGNFGRYQQYLTKALELDPGSELALDTQSGRCKYICSAGE